MVLRGPSLNRESVIGKARSKFCFKRPRTWPTLQKENNEQFSLHSCHERKEVGQKAHRELNPKRSSCIFSTGESNSVKYLAILKKKMRQDDEKKDGESEKGKSEPPKTWLGGSICDLISLRVNGRNKLPVSEE
jgi:hypothetical protein